jgi:TonB family protein
MPGTPTLFSTSITTAPARLIPERIYSTYADGAVYLIVSYNASTVEGTFQNYKAHHLFQGEATFERDVQLGKHRGKQYRLKFGNVVGVLQVFSTSKHGYAVATVQAREDVALSKYFLSSLQLTEDGSSPTAGANATSNIATSQASNLPQAVGQDPLTGRNVTRKAVVVSKPEPWYTNEARTANVTGAVVLRVVLSAGGEVTNIHAVSLLPRGLTEQAIEAAKSLRFIPAEKDGKFVSCWVELQYNFNQY